MHQRWLQVRLNRLQTNRCGCVGCARQFVKHSPTNAKLLSHQHRAAKFAEAFGYDEAIAFENEHTLNPATLLFEKVEDDAIDYQMQKLFDKKAAMTSQKAVTAVPAKENINYEAFATMDIRTGTILTAERVPKTKKLLKLTIDTGIDERTVVSGIAEYFEPEAIIGQRVSILVNLEPREIKGIQSQGMILMAENSEGKLGFVSVGDGMHNGSVIR